MGYYETSGYDGERVVDTDAIQRTFSQYGANYYGDGSEFIYSAGGYDLVNDIAVRNAAERAAQEARESEMAEMALIRMLAAQQREAMRNKYYKMGRTMVWFHNGKSVARALLIHDAKANCPYCFNASGEIGPFMHIGEAMSVIDEYYDDDMPTCPCPVCSQYTFNPKDPDYEYLTGIMNACKQALVSGRYHKEDYIKPKAPVAPPQPPKEYMEPTTLSTVRFLYEKSPSMIFLRNSKVDQYTVVREISSDGRNNVYQLDIVFEVPAKFSWKLPSVLNDVLILLRRYKDTRPISVEEKWSNISNTPISSYGETIEIMKLVPLTLLPKRTKNLSDGSTLASYRVKLIIDENDSPFTDGVYLFYLEVGGTEIEKFSIYHPRKLPDQPDKPYISGTVAKEYTAPKQTIVAPQASSKQNTQAPAQPADTRPYDNRTYKQASIAVDEVISSGSNPAVRNMRMEGFAVDVTSESIVYTVTVNTTEPLKVGSTINLFTCCVVNYSLFLVSKDLIPDDMIIRNRKAKVDGELQSPYQGQYCYTLKIGLTPLEWKKNAIKGRKGCAFKFEIIGVPLLEGSDVLSGVYTFS